MKKFALGCLVSVAVIAAVLWLAVWLLFIRALPALDATLAMPSEAERGNTISMVVTTTNPHDETVVLDSIDVDDSFLDGFQVVDVQPEPVDTMHIFGQRSWSFETGVSPGDSLEVRFTLRAVQAGHFSGDVDVCNPNQDFVTRIADVVIEE